MYLEQDQFAVKIRQGQRKEAVDTIRLICRDGDRLSQAVVL